MVSQDEIEKQLKAIDFNVHGWGRAEVKELPNVILPSEEIYEAVNGFYEGGFALLLATNIRVLLVDKKPLNYLTVEDMRFDNISEIDYSHRVIGAHVMVSAGDKHLSFTSYNQQRLRKLIGHTQHCMAKLKQEASDHQMDQKQHLEQLNQQLRAYLLQQHKQQQKLYEEISQMRDDSKAADKTANSRLEEFKPLEPDPALRDYLLAEGLLAQYAQQFGGSVALPVQQTTPKAEDEAPKPEPVTVKADPAGNQLADLYAAGMREIFGKQSPRTAYPQPSQVTQSGSNPAQGGEINPLKIAYSKLPQALRSKKFGMPFQGRQARKESEPEPA